MITERDPSGDHVMDFGLCLFFKEGCSTGAVLQHWALKVTGVCLLQVVNCIMQFWLD